jgi:hypothetical protein
MPSQRSGPSTRLCQRFVHRRTLEIPGISHRDLQVKENKTELNRLIGRIDHVVQALEDSKARNVIREDEYNDGLNAVSECVVTILHLCFLTFILLASFDVWRNLAKGCSSAPLVTRPGMPAKLLLK